MHISSKDNLLCDFVFLLVSYPLDYLYTICVFIYAFICWYSLDAYANVIENAKIICGIIINNNKK